MKMKGSLISPVVLVLVAAVVVQGQVLKSSICRDQGETCQRNNQCCRNLYCRRSGLGNQRRCVRDNGGINCRREGENCLTDSSCCKNLECRRGIMGSQRRCHRRNGIGGNCASMGETCNALRRCCVGNCNFGKCNL